MENSIDAFEISSRANPSRFIRGENSLSPFEGRGEILEEVAQASSKEGGFTFMEMPGPACKYLATTVRTPINFQPVFNFGRFQDGTSATDRLELYGQLFLSNQCKHFRLASISPEGRSCLFHQPGIRFRVSFVFGWNHLVSPPITVIFIPQMGGWGWKTQGWTLDSNRWIFASFIIEESEMGNFRKVSILRIARIL